jgi:hypothetical protein
MISSHSNLRDTGYLTHNNVPIVLRYVSQSSNFVVPVLSTQTLVNMNSQQLLQSTTRLFGPEFFLQTDPIRTVNRLA